jgi:hypothetical protein
MLFLHLDTALIFVIPHARTVPQFDHQDVMQRGPPFEVLRQCVSFTDALAAILLLIMSRKVIRWITLLWLLANFIENELICYIIIIVITQDYTRLHSR